MRNLKEGEKLNVDRVHERIDRARDPDERAGKIKDDVFDDPLNYIEQEKLYMTTDLEDWNDEALKDIY